MVSGRVASLAARGDPRLNPGIDVGFEPADGPSAKIDLLGEIPGLNAFVDRASAQACPFGNGGEAQHGVMGAMIGLLHDGYLQADFAGHQVKRSCVFVTESTKDGRHLIPGPRKLRDLDCQIRNPPEKCRKLAIHGLADI